MPAKRTSITTEAMSHSNPVPAASRVGDLLMSGIINGLDPARPGHAGSFEEQCALVFSRIHSIMAAAGGSTDQIVKVNLAVADIALREPINCEWLAMFPDPASRPARQTVAVALDRGKLIQADIVAWMGE